MRREYFPALDAIRSIACLFVISAHIVFDTLKHYLEIDTIWLNEILGFFFNNGGFGVHIFFVLSGFLITNLLIKENLDTGRINVKQFFIRRILRIWPLYMVVLLFGFLGYPAIKNFFGASSSSNEHIGFYLFFLSNFDFIRLLEANKSINSLLGITWSVSIEEQFYLLWPWLFFFHRKRNLVLGISLALIISILFILYSNLKQEILYRHTISNFLFLSSGGLLAYLYNFHKVKLIGFFNLGWGIKALIGATSLLLLIFSKNVIFNIENGLLYYWLFSAITISYFIGNQVFVNQKFVALSKCHLLINFGKYTYGIYMYHRIVQWVVNQVFQKVFFNDRGTFLFQILQICIILIFTGLISYISYEFIEKKIVLFKRKFEPFALNT